MIAYTTKLKAVLYRSDQLTGFGKLHAERDSRKVAVGNEITELHHLLETQA